MSDHWDYQLRVYLPDALADVARSDPANATLRPLTDILHKHSATLLSQLDAFEAYVTQADRDGPENFPLYAWTKATIADPAKRAVHAKSFALRVSDNEVYPKEIADAIQADLQPLIGGELVTRMSSHDTNPANNMPVPPEYRMPTPLAT